MKEESGFSLIETLVALALLGIIGVAFLGVLATSSSSRVLADEYVSAKISIVTKLVEAYFQVVEDEYGTGHVTGDVKYTVGGINADVNEYRSYDGWSMIIISASPETARYQLYLYEELALNSGYTNLDFDHDVTGGTVHYVVHN